MSEPGRAMESGEGAAPRPVRLQDYAPYPFEVSRVSLRVELDRSQTRVTCDMELARRGAGPLLLDGVGLELISIHLDGAPLSSDRYALEGDSLRVEALPEHCTLSTQVVISPAANKGDEGLFELHGKLATQCESEGFRRITFFPDRPDVLSRYDVTLVGDAERYPVMLSNGHPVSRGELADGRHWVRWEDPFPKPCYIFAIVAGDFACLSGSYRSRSGRDIALNIYADHDRIGECDFAMDALKRALAWEEEKYGREYDLDVYNIVALTGHVGAMENKGLNIFDANGICADPEVSTDLDYQVVERILAHEVFHNWTGNRVTCRDWFQLSLKEGLTRFRDQCFSQEASGGAVKRIEFVRALQRNQFPEDDGPAAHPVKPDQYIEIRNFYTGTVYDKGAEVIRMLHCLLGDELFREGVRRYLERFDLQAVTTEDFVAVLAETGGRDLTRFYRWYSQAGRPRVTASGHYDAAARVYTLTLAQHTAPTPGQPDKLPLQIPVLADLLGPDGEALEVKCPGVRRIDGNLLLDLREEEQVFRFEDVDVEPVPSLLRGFSAPVSLDAGLAPEQLALLWRCDSDPFNRWQSGQVLATDVIRELAGRWHRDESLSLPDLLDTTWQALLANRDTAPGLLAELLALPDEPALSEGLEHIDIDGHAAARNFLLSALAQRHRDALLERYHALADDGPYTFDEASAGRRSLRNRCLEFLLQNPDDETLGLCIAQLHEGGNMTDRFAALSLLCQVDCPQRQPELKRFYQRWQHKAPVIDKWFNAQALSRLPDAVEEFIALEQHPAMDLANLPRAMAFYGGFFRQNRVAFNDASGRAYDLLAERLILVDSLMPGTTYWLMPQILQWQRFPEPRRGMMRAALEKVLAADTSPALYETVSKALATD